jgi:hypothetical protein
MSVRSLLNLLPTGGETVTQSIVKSPGLIAYWDLQEPAGVTDVLARPDATMNATHTNVTAGVTGSNAIGVMASYDGLNSVTDGDSAALASAFDPDAGTLGLTFRASAAGVWSDTNLRLLAEFQVDGSNLIDIRSTGSDVLQINYIAAGTNEVFNIDASAYATDIHFVDVTWDTAADGGNGEFKAYVDGVQSGAAQAIDGVWAGTLLNVAFGALNTIPSFVWSGDLAHIALWNRALMADEILGKAKLGGVA